MSAPSAGRPRRVVTGRALLLGTMVLLLVVLLASPLQRYFNSRSDVSGAVQKLDQDRAQVDVLQQQLTRWGNPAYVQEQARARLQYALPGDTVYVIVNSGAPSDIQPAAGHAPSKSQGQGSWNNKLWTSVRNASDGS